MRRIFPYATIFRSKAPYPFAIPVHKNPFFAQYSTIFAKLSASDIPKNAWAGNMQNDIFNKPGIRGFLPRAALKSNVHWGKIASEQPAANHPRKQLLCSIVGKDNIIKFCIKTFFKP